MRYGASDTIKNKVTELKFGTSDTIKNKVTEFKFGRSDTIKNKVKVLQERAVILCYEFLAYNSHKHQ